MNEHELSAGLRVFLQERTRLPDVSSVHQQVLATPIEEMSQQRGWLPTFPRFQSMFNATKFVVAGVIVALFGGFLLIAQPFEQQGSVPGAATGGPGAFSPAGSLAQARAGHAASLLPDGRVLVVFGAPMSAEVWDPATESFESFGPARSFAQARGGATATFLSDGRVLIVGGDDTGDAVGRAEIWDPATASFGPTGSLTVARSQHTATLLPDGRVLVVGGYGDEQGLIEAEVWDPTTESFGPAGSLAEERQWHTATLLPDGHVLVVGGYDRRSAEVWDPATAAFEPTGSLAEGHAWHTATLLPDGRVLIVGGDCRVKCLANRVSAEVWDPRTATFEPAGSLAQLRESHTATLLPDGRVLVVGGMDGGELSITSTEIWDPTTASFDPGGSLAEGRVGHTATLLPDGRVLVIGGIDLDDDDQPIWPASAEVWAPGDG